VRVHLLFGVLIPLACFGCTERGRAFDDPSTELPNSGGFTPDDNSAAFHAADEGTPSSKEMAPLASPRRARRPPEKKPPPPPPPQSEVWTPHGLAGGTMETSASLRLSRSPETR
jgi:hypothetical protein